MNSGGGQHSDYRAIPDDSVNWPDRWGNPVRRCQRIADLTRQVSPYQLGSRRGGRVAIFDRQCEMHRLGLAETKIFRDLPPPSKMMKQVVGKENIFNVLIGDWPKHLFG